MQEIGIIITINLHARLLRDAINLQHILAILQDILAILQDILVLLQDFVYIS